MNTVSFSPNNFRIIPKHTAKFSGNTPSAIEKDTKEAKEHHLKKKDSFEKAAKAGLSGSALKAKETTATAAQKEYERLRPQGESAKTTRGNIKEALAIGGAAAGLTSEPIGTAAGFATTALSGPLSTGITNLTRPDKDGRTTLQRWKHEEEEREKKYGERGPHPARRW